MTINSIYRLRQLTVSDAGGNVAVGLHGVHTGTRVATLTPEDFAREITEAGIPGLTVTYEKPAPGLPTVPGWYAARDDIGSGRMYGVILLDADGEWQSRTSAEYWHHNRGGLVPMIPAKDADL